MTRVRHLKSKIHSTSEVVGVMEKNQAGKRVGGPGGQDVVMEGLSEMVTFDQRPWHREQCTQRPQGRFRLGGSPGGACIPARLE